MPWWGWLIGLYVVGVAAYLIAYWPRETCPRCFYPRFKCVCKEEDYGNDSYVAGTLRGIEGGKR